MGKLTIDEIIGHCKRKAEQYERLFGKERLETTPLISSTIKEYWEHRQVAEYLKKLKEYEDLEERLNKIYGDCDGLLESMVELLEEHSGVDIPDDTVKVLLITNESVDFYKKCKSLEEQGRLIKLPCKVGDTVYLIDRDENNKFKVYEGKWKRVSLVQASKDGSFNLCGEISYDMYDCFYDDGRIMSQNTYVGQEHTKIGEVVFFTKSEAEAKLKELRGEENGIRRQMR